MQKERLQVVCDDQSRNITHPLTAVRRIFEKLKKDHNETHEGEKPLVQRFQVVTSPNFKEEYIDYTKLEKFEDKSARKTDFIRNVRLRTNIHEIGGLNERFVNDSFKKAITVIPASPYGDTYARGIAEQLHISYSPYHSNPRVGNTFPLTLHLSQKWHFMRHDSSTHNYNSECTHSQRLKSNLTLSSGSWTTEKGNPSFSTFHLIEQKIESNYSNAKGIRGYTTTRKPNCDSYSKW